MTTKEIFDIIEDELYLTVPDFEIEIKNSNRKEFKNCYLRFLLVERSKIKLKPGSHNKL